MPVNKFIIKILVATLWFLCLLAGVYLIFHNKSRQVNTYDDDAVFVWGDSQMYQGLDVSLLGNALGKQVLTSACHGSGIYDFLVSEKSIPNNATCVLAFPECALLRNPLLDYNRTGDDIWCIFQLLKSGCPIHECVRIEKLNRRNSEYEPISYKVFSTDYGKLLYSDSIVYPESTDYGKFFYSDSIVYAEPLSGFCSMFTNKKDYFTWKAKSYEMGLQSLYDKHDQIILVQFPFEQQVENCAHNSINRHLTDSLKFELIEKYAMQHDSIVLHSDSLLMHDLSHMNEVGARVLTAKIAEILSADTVNNRFLRVVIE